MESLSNQLRAGRTGQRIPWHPAFIEALQMELRDYHDILEFYAEYQLTEEPLRIDCVVIKKAKNVEIKKNIAAIFKEWNLLEYKSPGDYVSVADFYKVYGYACLYASLEKVPIKDLSISFVENRHPKKLLKHLRNERGYTVAETAEGIYTIKGDIMPMQIINSRRLSADENLWLKSLSDELNSLEVTRISEEITRQEKGARIAAYLNAITEANTESIQEAMEMKKRLTFEQVMINCGLAAEWEAKGEAKGEARGEAKGKAESKLEIARKMKEMGDSVERIHTITGLPPEVVVSC